MINPLSISSFLTGISFIIAGVMTLKFPPKTVNNFYGYRTLNAMRDQESCAFAQKYSAKKMIRLGIFLSLFSIIGLWYNPGTFISTIVILLMLVGTILILFLSVERAINKNRQTAKNLKKDISDARYFKG